MLLIFLMADSLHKLLVGQGYHTAMRVGPLDGHLLAEYVLRERVSDFAVLPERFVPDSNLCHHDRTGSILYTK